MTNLNTDGPILSNLPSDMTVAQEPKHLSRFLGASSAYATEEELIRKPEYKTYFLYELEPLTYTPTNGQTTVIRRIPFSPITKSQYYKWEVSAQKAMGYTRTGNVVSDLNTKRGVIVEHQRTPMWPSTDPDREPFKYEKFLRIVDEAEAMAEVERRKMATAGVAAESSEENVTTTDIDSIVYDLIAGGATTLAALKDAVQEQYKGNMQLAGAVFSGTALKRLAAEGRIGLSEENFRKATYSVAVAV